MIERDQNRVSSPREEDRIAQRRDFITINETVPSIEVTGHTFLTPLELNVIESDKFGRECEFPLGASQSRGSYENVWLKRVKTVAGKRRNAVPL